MCGIVGFFKSNKNNFCSKKLIIEQVKLLQHRGPNNKGYLLEKNITLGHTRLSILDLSNKANQPMFSDCGRYVMTYNGEVYNFKNIKKKLKKLSFKTESDTEIILESISQFGVEKTLESLDGMFALGIWDKKKRKLFIARDRLGIKPLYWSLHKESFFFSSEMKTFKILPGFKPKVKKSSLYNLLRYSCIPSPNSIFENIHKVQPGELIMFGEDLRVEKKKYWSSVSLINDRQIYSNELSSCTDLIESELEKSISSTMVSDVPIGAFLSGGIDSSLVTSLMVKQSKKRIQTYSIGFRDKDFNEANYAKKISQHLQTDHNEAYVSEKDLLDVIPLLPNIYCEPFADSSQIPTYLVSKLSSKKTKVILSGDGADEIFGGYNRYFYAEKISQSTQIFPNIFKKILSNCLAFISKKNSLNVQDLFLRKKIPQFNEKLMKLSKIISNDKSFLYETLISSSQNCEEYLINFNPSKNIQNLMLNELDFFEAMQFQDLNNYLPNDILTKVDRASMYCSQEVRVPYLNKNIVKAAWSLPKEFKKNKLILRLILEKYVPKDLFDRPKMGFGIPLEQWLTGCLKDWMFSSLNKEKLESQGYFNINFLQNVTKNNKSIANNKYVLWNILMFQVWYDNFFSLKN